MANSEPTTPEENNSNSPDQKPVEPIIEGQGATRENMANTLFDANRQGQCYQRENRLNENPTNRFISKGIAERTVTVNFRQIQFSITANSSTIKVCGNWEK